MILAVTQPVPDAAPTWVSPVLEHAFFDIRDLMDVLRPHAETDLFLQLQTALDAIENADCELEKSQ
jgi:hypothetical protein